MNMMTRRLASLTLVVAGAVVIAAGTVRPIQLNEGGNDGSAAREELNVRELRARGAEGLREILERYDAKPDAAMAAEVDAVAGQRGAVWSRLYWHTDLESAKVAAKKEGKPILYLRLLGKLTDEYSCANSRFIRTALYANTRVAALLREKFVLVWVSERPVPVMTVDYGDGRVLKRTVTGNSAHYVLNADGRVVDVIPGLMDPITFERLVGAAGRAAMGVTEIDRFEKPRGSEQRRPMGYGRVTKGGVAQAPTAEQAERLTASKGGVETPMVRAFGGRRVEEKASPALVRAPRSLDERSVELMRREYPSLGEEKLREMVTAFEGRIAMDTAINVESLRPVALSWLAESPLPEVEAFNERVYRELFLTPRNDPWLGLVEPDAYAALTNGGCEVSVQESERPGSGVAGGYNPK